jgi:taurine dioxygenase
MEITIEPLTPAIGAIVSGVDLSQPLTSETRAAIESALLDRQVIFLRDQTLTEQQQRDFAAGFGPLHIHPIYPRSDNVPEIMLLDTALNDLRDNALWHSDVSFSETPSLGAVLLARKVPALGGDTLWASATAAYDALPETLKAYLGTLSATHDLAKSFPPERFGGDTAAREQLETAKRNNPPVVHPVIRKHPVTGKKAIFVSEGFTTGIVGLEQTMAEPLLNLLYTHVTRPEFTVRWKWREGDVAIWDNRVTQHYATYDYGNAHRVMNRATIVGDRPF